MRSRRTRGGWRRSLALRAAALAGAWFASSLQDGLLGYEPSRLVLDRRGAYLGEVPGDGRRAGLLAGALRAARAHRPGHARHRGPALLRAPRRAPAVGGARGWCRTCSNAASHLRGVDAGDAGGADADARGAHRRGARRARRWRRCCWCASTATRRCCASTWPSRPYGNRVHGVVRAARLYFDKPVEDLSWAAGRLPRGAAAAARADEPLHARMGCGAPASAATASSERCMRRAPCPTRSWSSRSQADLGLVPRPQRMPEALHAVLEWSGLARARQPAHLHGHAGPGGAVEGGGHPPAEPEPARRLGGGQHRGAGGGHGDGRHPRLRGLARLLQRGAPGGHRLREAAALAGLHAQALPLRTGTGEGHRHRRHRAGGYPHGRADGERPRLPAGEHQPLLPGAHAAARGAGQLAQHPRAPGAGGGGGGARAALLREGGRGRHLVRAGPLRAGPGGGQPARHAGGAGGAVPGARPRGGDALAAALHRRARCPRAG